MNCEQYISALVHATVQVRLHHWHPTKAGEVGSEAEHEALGELYDYLDGFQDDLVEAYQGQHGVISMHVPVSNLSIPVLEMLDTLISITVECYKADETPEWMKNQLQELEFRLYKFKYKLTITK